MGVGSLPRFAQQPRQTFRIPHYSRKALIAEVSLHAAATTADAITTRQLLNRHARTPPTIPLRRSRAKANFALAALGRPSRANRTELSYVAESPRQKVQL